VQAVTSAAYAQMFKNYFCSDISLNALEVLCGGSTDLAKLLEDATEPEEKLRLLRGLFFWLQVPFPSKFSGDPSSGSLSIHHLV